MSDTKTYPNYINGEWVGGDATFENRNPADTGEVVGAFAKGSPASVTAAAGLRFSKVASPPTLSPLAE